MGLRRAGRPLHLGAEPDPFRGFSGEGTLLTLLADSEAEAHARRLLGELCWSPVVHPTDLAERTGLGADQVASGLGGSLPASGSATT